MVRETSSGVRGETTASGTRRKMQAAVEKRASVIGSVRTSPWRTGPRSRSMVKARGVMPPAGASGPVAIEEDLRVEKSADGAAEHRPDPVDPLILPEAGGQRRAEGSGRVERRAGERPPCQYITRERQSDRQPRKANRRLRMHGGPKHHDDQDEGHEGFQEQRG